MGMIITKVAAESSFMHKQQQQIDVLTKTAEQRYLNLFTEQPQLMQSIPLKYIASYIGVTPQALSRIRKRIY